MYVPRATEAASRTIASTVTPRRAHRFAERRKAVDGDEEIDHPEHARQLKLHGDRDVGRHGGDCQQKDRDERRRAPHEPAIQGRRGAAALAGHVRPPEDRQ